MFVAFILLFLVLAKWGWPVIIKMMDKRASTIDEGVENARQAKEQLDNARAEADRYMKEVMAEIIEQARNEAAKVAQGEMDAAKVSIEQARKQAESQIRDEVSRFSIEIAEKMMRSQLKDTKAQTELVNKMLDDIEKN